MKTEKEFYELVRRNLEEYFCKRAEECFFEITAEKVGDKIMEKLSDEVLFLIGSKELRPDIMGYVKVPIGLGLFLHSEFKVAVEVKNGKPTVNDIFQAKKYGELYNAAISILISTDKPEERVLRLLERRKELLSYYYGYYHLYLARFSKEEKKIVWWYPEEPRKV